MKCLIIAAALLAVVSCASSEEHAGDSFQSDDRPMAKTLVYECLGYEFIARRGPGEMAVWLEDQYLILSQVRSASGVKYQEGEVAFWTKGEDSTLFIKGQRYGDCQLAPSRAPWEDARRRGVNFRAVGNEPGWSLELKDGQQLLYVGDYGGSRVMTSDPGAQWQQGSRLYHAVTEVDELVLEIANDECHDTMSGELFPSTVTLVVNGKSLQGCGRDLVIPWE
jgi:uncharacterized membrane protein